MRAQLRFPLLSFRLHGHGIATYPPGTTFGPRVLTDFELVWLLEGDAVWEVNGREIAVAAGSVMLGRPGMRDGFRWDARRRTRHGFIHFALEPASAYLAQVDGWPLHHQPAPDTVLPALLRQVAALIADGRPEVAELTQSALRHTLLTFLAGEPGRELDHAPEEHPVMQAVHAHLRELWQESELPPITLGDLARVAGVSKVHLTRVFQREVGVAPIEAVRLLRLERGAALLARTNLQVGVIARICGFPNPFHFTKAFRAIYASSPRQVRERARRGEAPPTLGLTRVHRFGAAIGG